MSQYVRYSAQGGGGGGGSGTVTSVALALPNIFSVSGSPVTTSGTLTGTLATQAANLVLASATSGGAATPAFRSLVTADIPSLTAAKITGTASRFASFNTSGVLEATSNYQRTALDGLFASISTPAASDTNAYLFQTRINPAANSTTRTSVVTADLNIDENNTGFNSGPATVFRGQVSHVTNTDVGPINIFDAYSNFGGSGSTTGITSFTSNFDLGASYDGGDITGYNVNGDIDGTADSVTGLKIGYTGSGVVDEVVGISIDLNSVVSPNRKTGLSINDGIIQIGADTTTQSNIDVDFVNGLSNSFTVEAASPITGTDYIALSIGGDITFNDDMAANGALGVGWVSHGTLAEIEGANGKTLGQANIILAAAYSEGAGTGTVTLATLFNAYGILDFGGSGLQVTNLAGYYAGTSLNSVGATNAWGVRIDATDVDNFFSKSVTIGGSSKKATNASVALEIGGTTKAFLNAVMTTTQRDALTAVEGMQIFNTTTKKLNYYDGTVWVAL